MSWIPTLPWAPASAIKGLVARLRGVIEADFATCACGIQLRRPARWLAAAEVPKFQTPP